MTDQDRLLRTTPGYWWVCTCRKDITIKLDWFSSLTYPIQTVSFLNYSRTHFFYNNSIDTCLRFITMGHNKKLLTFMEEAVLFSCPNVADPERHQVQFDCTATPPAEAPPPFTRGGPGKMRLRRPSIRQIHDHYPLWTHSKQALASIGSLKFLILYILLL